MAEPFSWVHQHGDSYIVTGITAAGKRFRRGPFERWLYANSINLYRGSIWLCGPSSKWRRKLVKRVWN